MTKVFDPADYQLETIVGVSGLTVGQKVTMYRDAPKKGKQLCALCDLSGMSEEQIKALLLANGVNPMEMPRKRRNAEPKPEEKDGTAYEKGKLSGPGWRPFSSGDDGVEMVVPPMSEKETPSSLDIPAAAKEAFARAAAAINDLADLFAKYVEAQAAALRKLQKIKELLDREGVHRDEP